MAGAAVGEPVVAAVAADLLQTQEDVFSKRRLRWRDKPPQAPNPMMHKPWVFWTGSCSGMLCGREECAEYAGMVTCGCQTLPRMCDLRCTAVSTLWLAATAAGFACSESTGNIRESSTRVDTLATLIPAGSIAQFGRLSAIVDEEAKKRFEPSASRANSTYVSRHEQRDTSTKCALLKLNDTGMHGETTIVGLHSSPSKWLHPVRWMLCSRVVWKGRNYFSCKCHILADAVLRAATHAANVTAGIGATLPPLEPWSSHAHHKHVDGWTDLCYTNRIRMPPPIDARVCELKVFTTSGRCWQVDVQKQTLLPGGLWVVGFVSPEDKRLLVVQEETLAPFLLCPLDGSTGSWPIHPATMVCRVQLRLTHPKIPELEHIRQEVSVDAGFAYPPRTAFGVASALVRLGGRMAGWPHPISAIHSRHQGVRNASLAFQKLLSAPDMRDSAQLPGDLWHAAHARLAESSLVAAATAAAAGKCHLSVYFTCVWPTFSVYVLSPEDCAIVVQVLRRDHKGYMRQPLSHGLLLVYYGTLGPVIGMAIESGGRPGHLVWVSVNVYQTGGEAPGSGEFQNGDEPFYHVCGCEFLSPASWFQKQYDLMMRASLCPATLHDPDLYLLLAQKLVNEQVYDHADAAVLLSVIAASAYDLTALYLYLRRDEYITGHDIMQVAWAAITGKPCPEYPPFVPHTPHARKRMISTKTWKNGIATHTKTLLQLVGAWAVVDSSRLMLPRKTGVRALPGFCMIAPLLELCFVAHNLQVSQTKAFVLETCCPSMGNVAAKPVDSAKAVSSTPRRKPALRISVALKEPPMYDDALFADTPRLGPELADDEHSEEPQQAQTDTEKEQHSRMKVPLLLRPGFIYQRRAVHITSTPLEKSTTTSC